MPAFPPATMLPALARFMARAADATLVAPLAAAMPHAITNPAAVAIALRIPTKSIAATRVAEDARESSAAAGGRGTCLAFGVAVVVAPMDKAVAKSTVAIMPAILLRAAILAMATAIGSGPARAIGHATTRATMWAKHTTIRRPTIPTQVVNRTTSIKNLPACAAVLARALARLLRDWFLRERASPAPPTFSARPGRHRREIRSDRDASPVCQFAAWNLEIHAKRPRLERGCFRLFEFKL